MDASNKYKYKHQVMSSLLWQVTLHLIHTGNTYQWPPGAYSAPMAPGTYTPLWF